MKNRTTNRLVGLALAAGMTLGLAGCRQAQPAQPVAVQEQGILVETSRPETGDLTLTTEFIGTIKPDELVSVFPKIAGTVLATHVEVGQVVKKGDLLFEIDPTDIQLQVDIAAAGLETARTAAERAMGSSYDLQLIQSEAQLDSAQVAYNNAKKRLDNFRDNADDTLDELEAREDAARELVQAAERVYQARKADYDAAVRRYNELAGNLPPAPKDDESSADESLDGKLGEELTVKPVAPPEESSAAPEESSAAPDSSDVPQESHAEAASSDAPVSSGMESGVQSAYVRGSRFLRAATDQEIAAAKEDMEVKKGLMQGAMADYQAAMAQYEGAQQAYDAASGSFDDNASDLRIARYAAQVSYEAAEKSYDIAKNKGYAEAAASTEAQLRQAEASFKASAKQLEYTKIYAPIDGVIEQKTIDAQGIATQQNPAYTVSNKDNMMVTFYVSSDAVTAMREGDAVTVECGGNTYGGAVVEIGTMVDAQSGLFQVRAVVNDADDSLKTGLSVKVSAVTARASGSILIPQSAVYYDKGEPYVYLLQEGKAVRTSIVTGVSNEEKVEVLAGMDRDSQLITSWHPNLLDGAAVRDTGAAEPAMQQDASAAGKELEAASSSHSDNAGSSSDVEG